MKRRTTPSNLALFTSPVPPKWACWFVVILILAIAAFMGNIIGRAVVASY